MIGIALVALVLPAEAFAQSSIQLRSINNRSTGGISGGLNGGIRGGVNGGINGSISGSNQNIPRSLVDRNNTSVGAVRARIRQLDPSTGTTTSEVPGTTGTTPGEIPGTISGTTH